MSTFAVIVAIGLMVVAFVVWVYCLFDVVVRPDKSAAGKAAWTLALLFLAPVAIVVYLAFARGRANSATAMSPERS